MLSTKVMIFSYSKTSMYLCSVTQVFNTRMACFQVIFFLILMVKFHKDLTTTEVCFAVARVIA